MSNTVVVKEALKLVGLPDNLCFKSLQDLVTQIPKLFSVEIPSSVTNVVVSNVQPSDPAAVWFALSNTNVFLGVRVYSAGKWIQVFPAPQQVFWTYGDSRDISPGYQLITTGVGGIPSSTVTHIMSQYQRDPGDTYYMYFATIFTGV